MQLTFRVSKLLEYAEDVERLEASDNPFAAVVLAHCKTIETRHDPESRRAWKLRIVKGLYRRHWTKEDIRQLFRVIDWIMALPEDLEEAFRADLDDFEEGDQMRYVTSIERLQLKRGAEEGQRAAFIESIALDLNDRFGPSGRMLLGKVRALQKVAALRKAMRFVKKAKSLDEVRAYFD